MPKTLVIPLTLNSDGTFATTDNAAEVVRLRILDLLVTSNWERVHRPAHGCDLEGFLYNNVVSPVLSLKAQEIKTEINLLLTYGQVVQVLMTQLVSPQSAVQVDVLYKVYEGGEMEQLTEVFTGRVEEGNPL